MDAPTRPASPLPAEGYPPLPTVDDPWAGRPRPTPTSRRRPGWIVAGAALLVVAVLQLLRSPQWLAHDERGMVGNLTGVVALVGIGIALIVTGRERRR